MLTTMIDFWTIFIKVFAPGWKRKKSLLIIFTSEALNLICRWGSPFLTQATSPMFRAESDPGDAVKYSLSVYSHFVARCSLKNCCFYQSTLRLRKRRKKRKLSGWQKDEREKKRKLKCVNEVFLKQRFLQAGVLVVKGVSLLSSKKSSSSSSFLSRRLVSSS